MKSKLASEPATKDDLKNFATKDDLKNLATKDDLKNFATKDDLKNFATKTNLSALELRVDIKMDRMEDRINEKARQYRDEILTKLDGIMGELVNAREERIFMNRDIDNHEQRIRVLEKSHH